MDVNKNEEIKSEPKDACAEDHNPITEAKGLLSMQTIDRLWCCTKFKYIALFL
jgi:hypothetical protein